MQTDYTLKALVAASLIPRLNSRFCLPLIERCGGLEAFFMEKESHLEKIYREANIPPGTFNRRQAMSEAPREMECMQEHGIRVCAAGDGTYPVLLEECEDSPLVLYYKGKLGPEKGDTFLGVVGTRHSSIRYQQRVEDIISDFSSMPHPPVIVSGLAYGIDATAHSSALKYGVPTLAVLGHGLHRTYPARHRSLALSIISSGGCLISEFPCISAVYPSNFLKRNRIIAGLCHGLLVAESAVKGGAMSTARIAFSYNREVMALPGRFDDTWSSGCNRLIKRNMAALVEDSKDIARQLNLPWKNKEALQTAFNLCPDEEKSGLILSLLNDRGDTDIDGLSLLSGIPDGELAGLLLEMELDGKILALPGKRFAVRK